MEFIEKHKALIITSMLMGIFVLSLINISMIRKQKAQSEILMEIPEEFLLDEEPPQEELTAQENKLIAAKETNKVFNEDFEDHDEIEERIKSLTEAEKEVENEETEAIEDEAIPLEEKKEKGELKEDETDNRNSSLTYSLRGRKAVDLPNPVYTCNGNGKVVVNIEVNQNGYVIGAKVDKRKTTTRNECLFDNAIEYARKALFSRSGVSTQEGSITYYFNYGT